MSLLFNINIISLTNMAWKYNCNYYYYIKQRNYVVYRINYSEILSRLTDSSISDWFVFILQPNIVYINQCNINIVVLINLDHNSVAERS